MENRIADLLASRGGLPQFLDALAAPTPAPGGGSASAAAAAMAAALGIMVTALAKQDGSAFEEERRFFTDAVDRDAEAFERVMAAYRRPREERGPGVEQALRGAAEVPLQVLEHAAAMKTRLDGLEIPAKFGSDLAVAKALTDAALIGALENVRINLGAIKDDGVRASIASRLSAAGVRGAGPA